MVFNGAATELMQPPPPPALRVFGRDHSDSVHLTPARRLYRKV
jgi:hypothetical protein